MKKKSQINLPDIVCRVCGNHDKLSQIYTVSNESFKYFFPYSFRKKKSLGFFCPKCGSLSFYQRESIDYKKGGYRKGNNSKSPPVDLPWSTITYKRHIHICKVIHESVKPNFSFNQKRFLDFGGYNGFGAYGICNELGFDLKNTYIADMDPNGLSIAKALGFSTYDLSSRSLKQHLLNDSKKFSLVTAIHVLEHLEDPSLFFTGISNHVDKNSIIYVEVPSRYFFPLEDPAHLITYSKQGMVELAHRNNFQLIHSATVNTPKESILYGYPFSSSREAVYFVFRYTPEINKQSHGDVRRFESIIKFIIYSSLSNLSLRIVIFKNYFITYMFYSLKLARSLIILFLSPILATLVMLKSITKNITHK